MNMPSLSEPSRYCGLYVFDFGEWTAVGYTAEEVAMLLESEQFRRGKVYRIVRADPAGRIELRGISGERFQLESGMFFNRADADAARLDFETLQHLAEHCPPPCRAVLHLAERPPAEGVARYVTALIYPAEYEDDMARWLDVAGYAGGDLVEGGISHVSNYSTQEKTILARQQLWSRPSIPSRSADEVFATVRRAVQR